MEEWAKRVRKWRKKNAMTQLQMARAMGVSRRAIQWIEAGIVTPRIPTIRKFNRIKDLYQKEEEMNAARKRSGIA